MIPQAQNITWDTSGLSRSATWEAQCLKEAFVHNDVCFNQDASEIIVTRQKCQSGLDGDTSGSGSSCFNKPATIHQVQISTALPFCNSTTRSTKTLHRDFIHQTPRSRKMESIRETARDTVSGLKETLVADTVDFMVNTSVSLPQGK